MGSSCPGTLRDEWKLALETNLERAFQAEGMPHAQKVPEAETSLAFSEKIMYFRTTTRIMHGGRCDSTGWQEQGD